MEKGAKPEVEKLDKLYGEYIKLNAAVQTIQELLKRPPEIASQLDEMSKTISQLNENARAAAKYFQTAVSGIDGKQDAIAALLRQSTENSSSDKIKFLARLFPRWAQINAASLVLRLTLGLVLIAAAGGYSINKTLSNLTSEIRQMRIDQNKAPSLAPPSSDEGKKLSPQKGSRLPKSAN